jgi:hypothetical protein
MVWPWECKDWFVLDSMLSCSIGHDRFWEALYDGACSPSG